MSKRLQITLTDESYEKLLIIMDSVHMKNKSSIINAGIYCLYDLYEKNNVIADKKEPCQ